MGRRRVIAACRTMLPVAVQQAALGPSAGVSKPSKHEQPVRRQSMLRWNARVIGSCTAQHATHRRQRVSVREAQAVSDVCRHVLHRDRRARRPQPVLRRLRRVRRRSRRRQRRCPLRLRKVVLSRRAILLLRHEIFKATPAPRRGAPTQARMRVAWAAVLQALTDWLAECRNGVACRRVQTEICRVGAVCSPGLVPVRPLNTPPGSQLPASRPAVACCFVRRCRLCGKPGASAPAVACRFDYKTAPLQVSAVLWMLLRARLQVLRTMLLLRCCCCCSAAAFALCCRHCGTRPAGQPAACVQRLQHGVTSQSLVSSIEVTVRVYTSHVGGCSVFQPERVFEPLKSVSWQSCTLVSGTLSGRLLTPCGLTVR